MAFDTHIHLDPLPRWREQLATARRHGVSGWLSQGTHPEQWPALLGTADEPGVSLAIGVHPHWAQRLSSGWQASLSVLLAHPRCLAVGEVGLDRVAGDASMEQQLAVLDDQLALAQQHRLPLCLHSRGSVDALAKRLRDAGRPRGVLHAFIGSQQQAARALDQGVLIGIGGSASYPRAARLHRVIRALPDDGFVLETDAPYQPLCGHQGEANHPSLLMQVAQVVAQLRGTTTEAILHASDANATKLFGLPPLTARAKSGDAMEGTPGVCASDQSTGVA